MDRGGLAEDLAGGGDLSYDDARFDVINGTQPLGTTLGAYDTHDVVITVTGTNDRPEILVITDAASLTEANGEAQLTANGDITWTDLDITNAVVLSPSYNDDIAWSAGNINDQLSQEQLTALTTNAFSITGLAQDGWQYSAAQNLDFLREGETITLSFDVVATDNSNQANNTSDPAQTVTVTITGTNDSPVISDNVVTADLTETGAAISANGSISVLDPDTSDSLSADVTSVVIGGTFSTSGSTLPAALSDNDNQALIDMLSLGATTGISADQPDGSSITWTFTSGAQDTAAFSFLKAGETLTLDYTLTLTDNANTPRSDTTHVLITITGTNNNPTVSALSYNNTEDENSYVINLLSTAEDVDLNDVLSVESYTVSAVDQDQENITIPDGALSRDGAALTVTPSAFSGLAGDESVQITVNYSVSDGTASTPNTATITIAGGNTPPSLTVEHGDSAAAGINETNSSLTASGSLTATDPDLSNTASISNISVVASGIQEGLLSNAEALRTMLQVVPAEVLANDSTTSQFNWDFDSGSESFDYLAVGEALVLTYTLTLTDSFGEADTQEVVITITGTNDQPEISAITESASLSKPMALLQLTANGDITWSDRDSNGSVTLTPTYNGDIAWSAGDITLVLNADQITALTAAGDSKAFSITGVDQDGWQYSAAQNLDFLRQGETITFSFNVIATDDTSQPNSDSTAQIVTITITGANDAPVITTGLVSGSVTETDATISTTGDFSVADPDTSDTVTASVQSVTIAGSFNSTVPSALTDSSNQQLLNMLSLNPVAGAVLDADQPTGSDLLDLLFRGRR